MTDHEAEHGRIEKTVLDKFFLSYGKAALESCRHGDPLRGEPDMLCGVRKNAALESWGIELTEAVDRSFTLRFANSRGIEERILAGIAGCRAYKTSLICLHLRGRSRARKPVAKAVELLSDYELPEGTHSFDWGIVEIIKGRFDGPVVQVTSAGPNRPPWLYVIEKKFGKDYNFGQAAIRGLLVYHELAAHIPIENRLPDIKKYVRQNMKNSVFNTVWLYDAAKNKLVWSYGAAK